MLPRTIREAFYRAVRPDPVRGAAAESVVLVVAASEVPEGEEVSVGVSAADAFVEGMGEFHVKAGGVTRQAGHQGKCVPAPLTLSTASIVLTYRPGGSTLAPPAEPGLALGRPRRHYAGEAPAISGGLVSPKCPTCGFPHMILMAPTFTFSILPATEAIEKTRNAPFIPSQPERIESTESGYWASCWKCKTEMCVTTDGVLTRPQSEASLPPGATAVPAHRNSRPQTVDPIPQRDEDMLAEPKW